MRHTPSANTSAAPSTHAPTWLLTLCCSLIAGTAHARDLQADFQAASQYEPTFIAAQTQTRNMRIDATIASTAYFPRGGVSLSQDPTDNSTRRTARITQPIASADRWLTTREAAPRENIATQLDAQARIDLASRLFNAVHELTLSREKLALHQANLQSLQAQNESAKLANQVGQGTITDVLDTQVRLAQARAQISRLQADHETAQRTYASITGYLPAPNAYPLSPRSLSALQTPPLEETLAQTLESNPRLQMERQNTALSAIQARRARAQFLPSVNATWQRSTTSTATTNQSGLVLSLDMPLQYSSTYAFETADNALLGQQQKERATHEGLMLDIQRLHAQAQAAQQEVDISREAIDAATLSVNANEQSFAGGVRSKLDVLNALQAQLSAREAHLSAQLSLARTLLSLRLLAGHDIDTILQQVQRELFDPRQPPA
jgi:outer membrane protein TolC